MEVKSICDKIKESTGVHYEEHHLTQIDSFSKYITFDPRIKKGLPGFGFFTNHIPDIDKPNKIIHCDTSHAFLDVVRNVLVELDLKTQNIYYYPDLYITVNQQWHDYKQKPGNENVIFISGDYTSVPFTRFKDNNQITKFCIMHYKRLNARYEHLLKELPIRAQQFWDNLDKASKCREETKRLKVLGKDFD